jgi:hypothetical protein
LHPLPLSGTPWQDTGLAGIKSGARCNARCHGPQGPLRVTLSHDRRPPAWLHLLQNRPLRLRGAGLAVLLGQVEAPDEESAIKRAIEEFKISPTIQKRLLAQRRP